MDFIARLIAFNTYMSLQNELLKGYVMSDKSDMELFTKLEATFKEHDYEINKIDFSKDMGAIHITVNKPKR